MIFYILTVAKPVLSRPISGPPAGTLPHLTPGEGLGIAPGIPTVPNLRDPGGYKTHKGAIVARGLAYLCDTFNPMTAEDLTKLECLSLKSDYDPRITAEFKAKPDEMPLGVRCSLYKPLGARAGRVWWPAGSRHRARFRPPSA